MGNNIRAVPFLAYKDLIRDKRIVIMVILLLTFSFVNLTFFPAFLNGLSNTFQDEVVDTGTSHIIITPRAESDKKYLSMESSTRKKIDDIPGIVGSSAHISAPVTIRFKNKELGAPLVALTPSKDIHVTVIDQKVIKGDYLTDDDTGEILLGQVIAGTKIEDRIGSGPGFGAQFAGLGGIDPGEKVIVRFANGIEKEYRVKGILGSQGFSFVSQQVFITTKDVEEVLGLDNQASEILVRVIDKNKADDFKALILDLGIGDSMIRTWEEASNFAAGINQTFGAVNVVTTFVGIVIVLATVAIVIFINTSRKKRIIGVLKAVGMHNNMIMYIFLFESLIFGIVGGLLGVGVISASLGYFKLNPIDLPIGLLVPTLSFQVIIQSFLLIVASSIIAGYIPARSASRQQIIETIKVVE